MINVRKKIKRNGGQVLLTAVILFLFVSLTAVIGVSDPVLRQATVTNDFLGSRKSYFSAEAGIEDIVYRIKTNKQVPVNQNLILDGNTVAVSVSGSSNIKTVYAVASNNNLVRGLETVLNTGVGSSFNYGIQTGAGGFILNNNATINGSVYANGSIVGSNGAKITGAAFSAGSISNVTVGANGVGDASAYRVTNSTVTGNLYCQTGSGNNKPCNTSKPAPTQLDSLISDSSITQWKNDAAAGGVINGDYTISSSGSLGPKKIAGNLNINGSKILTLTGTVWVTGNINMNNGAEIKLATSYGSNSGEIVVDGMIDVSNNSTFAGSGTTGSYIMVLTTSDCPISSSCNGNYAIDISNNVGSVILYAGKGTIHLNNNSSVKEATGYQMVLDNGATVNYESGIANVNFTSGPTGGWNIKSWQEIE